MKILYHHRTRSTDAQRIHILEIVSALRSLGHTVELVSVVPTETKLQDAKRDAGDAFWKKFARRIPFAYDLIQLGYNLAGIPLLLSRALRNRPDMIYERYSLFNFSAVLVGRLCRLPVVLEVNSPMAIEHSREKDTHLRRFAAWTERVICNLATRVIVVSTPLARILLENGVHSVQLEVMPNGVNLNRFQSRPASPDLKKSLGISSEIVIGFVGWFRKWHGIELLLEAFQAADLHKRAKVLLVGDGQAMADLQAYVDTHGLREDVIFTGPLPHNEVAPYVDLIDIAVQPAANEYCCPMKILEYMALGKAIAAPDQENIRELLVPDAEAKFFSPKDAKSLANALLKLVNEPRDVERLGRAARRAIDARKLLWSENARRVVELACDSPSRCAPSSTGTSINTFASGASNQRP